MGRPEKEMLDETERHWREVRRQGRWHWVMMAAMLALFALFLFGCDDGWQGRAALNCEQYEDGSRDIACVQDHEAGRR